MSDEESPSIEDLEKLICLYETARSYDRPFEWKDGNPDYPESVEELFRYIHHSPWCYKKYEPQEVKKSYERVPVLSLNELRSILTSFTRSEHYCYGAWETILERDQFGPVLRRLQELLVS